MPLDHTPSVPPRVLPVSGSGIEVPTVAGPSDVDPGHIGEPGRFPFTRGIFPDGYRGRLWTIRQYSGFGTAEESNQRYKFLLASGQTGLSVALDLPTQCGYDPVDPMARPEIGKVGVSLSNLSEMEILFDGIDLGEHLDLVHDQRHGRDHLRDVPRGAPTSRACRARS